MLVGRMLAFTGHSQHRPYTSRVWWVRHTGASFLCAALKTCTARRAANASWETYIAPISSTFTVSLVRSMLTSVMSPSLLRLIWQHRPQNTWLRVWWVHIDKKDQGCYQPHQEIWEEQSQEWGKSDAKLEALRRLPNSQHIRLRGNDVETFWGWAHRNRGATEQI